MEKYRHFNVASYLYAYDAEKLSDAEIRRGVEQYLRYLPLNKVYVENHRAKSDVPVSRLCQIKALLEEYGLTVSGGITSTALVGKEQKPSLFDTFCYTDPAHKAEYLRIVREAASVFDEIILDDYFFPPAAVKNALKQREASAGARSVSVRCGNSPVRSSARQKKSGRDCALSSNTPTGMKVIMLPGTIRRSKGTFLI